MRHELNPRPIDDHCVARRLRKFLGRGLKKMLLPALILGVGSLLYPSTPLRADGVCHVTIQSGQCLCHNIDLSTGDGVENCPSASGISSGHDCHLANYCCEQASSGGVVPVFCNLAHCDDGTTLCSIDADCTGIGSETCIPDYPLFQQAPYLDCSSYNTSPLDRFGKCGGCGDGLKTDGEQCDDGSNTDGKCEDSHSCLSNSDCVHPELHEDGTCNANGKCNTDGCNANDDCNPEVTATTGPDNDSICVPDGCTRDCQLESCGDNVVFSGPDPLNPIEQCDDGKQCTDGTDCTNDPTVCADIGDGSCATRDGDGCSSECVTEFCGDGITNNSTEQCDDGQQCKDGTTPCTTPDDCIATLGDDGTCAPRGGDGCDANCQTECGNGQLDPGEACDPSVEGTECCNQDCTLNTGDTCDDGDACTTNDMCSEGQCTGGSPLSCDDQNGCTDDTCDPQSGCQHTNNTASCDDGDACTTNDVCSEGQCTGGSPLSCDDQNGCTDDTCDSKLGCQHSNNSNSCDDGNACTTNDTCSEGQCAGGSPLSCDDQNGCTDDSCDPRSGCQHSNNTNFCDDGNACTTNDTCSEGQCAGGAPLSCDDQNVCTDDSCDPQSGCQHTNNTDPCEDGLLCTTGDTCSDGQCAGGPPPNCDDGNVCTDDSCVELQSLDGPAPRAVELPLGCVNTPNSFSDSCYDGPEGTEGVGACHGGTKTCGDGVFGSCDGEVTPSPEVCDGIDNNCNGQVDEGFGQTTCGLGICEHTVDNCADGQSQTCDPLEGQKAEICGNGIDENCDGMDDDCAELAGCIAIPGNNPANVTFGEANYVGKAVVEVPFDATDPENDTINLSVSADKGNAVVDGDVIQITLDLPLDPKSDGTVNLTAVVTDSGSCQQTTVTEPVRIGVSGQRFGARGGCSLVR